MSDLISREAAIDVLARFLSNREGGNAVWWKPVAESVINVLPSAQSERKTGRWIPLQLSIAYPPYQCSCCFKNAPMIETGCLMNRHLEALLTDFCPNCGADMRGGK